MFLPKVLLEKKTVTMKVTLASSNKGKLAEFQQLLSGLNFDVVPQSDFQVPDAVENGLSFVENALIKARHASRLTGLPAIADDSGLEVDKLNGAPGIYSSRFSGENANDEKNNMRLLSLLQDTPESERTARFQCVLVYMRHPEDPTPIICQGTWEGLITDKANGNNGFGYDPIFYVPEFDCTSAELEPSEKNKISHRGRAMAKLLEQLSR
jgi:XTP/dITP diphosphohydrolase